MEPEREAGCSSAADSESVPTLELYQRSAADAFLGLLPDPCTDILEIGSDLEGRTISYLASRTGANVAGINPSPRFAASPPPRVQASKEPDPSKEPHRLRADGRQLPFADGSFDAILSIATLEHVNGVEQLLAEVTRVLRPEGVFHVTFDPIWTCGIGHHVYAVVGGKEARFWKAGKNPVPDFAHLLMEPEQMRDYLRSGPCSEELIDPIIDWIYHGDDINRLPFSRYLDAFETCPLRIEGLRYLYGPKPSPADLEILRWRVGANENFGCSGFVVTFRKTLSWRRGRRRWSQGAAVRRRTARMIFSPRMWRKLPRLFKMMLRPAMWSRLLNRLEDLLNDPDR
jgi:SAM-dependent methyltransferase